MSNIRTVGSEVWKIEEIESTIEEKNICQMLWEKTGKVYKVVSITADISPEPNRLLLSFPIKENCLHPEKFKQELLEWTPIRERVIWHSKATQYVEKNPT